MKNVLITLLIFFTFTNLNASMSGLEKVQLLVEDVGSKPCGLTRDKIIKSTKCKTFFVNSFMENDKYILEVEQIYLDQSSQINFSKDLNLYMENKIKLNPEEYLWQHRRFKSTLGKESFYV